MQHVAAQHALHQTVGDRVRRQPSHHIGHTADAEVQRTAHGTEQRPLEGGLEYLPEVLPVKDGTHHGTGSAAGRGQRGQVGPCAGVAVAVADRVLAVPADEQGEQPLGTIEVARLTDGVAPLLLFVVEFDY